MNSYRLKELLKIKNGKDHKDLPDGYYPVYGSGGLMRYVNDYIYDKESILLPRKGTLSNIQYVNTPFWTVDTLYYTIVDTKKVNAFYLYYLIKQFDLSKLNTGTGVPSMTFDAYYDLEVSIPKLEIQDKVARILNALDSKIALNNRINAELEAMAKTLYDYWFVQFDFPYDFVQGKPDSAGKPYKSSGGKMVWNEELKREIPEGWEIKSINELIEVKDGTHDSPKTQKEGYKLITSKSLLSSGIDFKNANFISEEDYININKRSKVETGDILFSMIGSIGVVYKVEDEDIKFAVKNVALYKTSQKQDYKNYIYQYLKSYDMENYMGNVISGSIQKFISLGSLRNMPLLINDPLIHKYQTTTEKLFLLLENNKQENLHLSSLRDWLLPMLMNGQVKVESV